MLGMKPARLAASSTPTSPVTAIPEARAWARPNGSSISTNHSSGLSTASARVLASPASRSANAGTSAWVSATSIQPLVIASANSAAPGRLPPASTSSRTAGVTVTRPNRSLSRWNAPAVASPIKGLRRPRRTCPPCVYRLGVVDDGNCGSLHHRNTKLRYMLDEGGRAKSGEPCRSPKREAAVAVQSRSERAPNTRFGEERLVVEMKQNRFRLMPVEHHDGMFPRSAQCHGRIVLQFTHAERFHVPSICRNISRERHRRKALSISFRQRRQVCSWLGPRARVLREGAA